MNTVQVGNEVISVINVRDGTFNQVQLAVP